MGGIQSCRLDRRLVRDHILSRFGLLARKLLDRSAGVGNGEISTRIM